MQLQVTTGMMIDSLSLHPSHSLSCWINPSKTPIKLNYSACSKKIFGYIFVIIISKILLQCEKKYSIIKKIARLYDSKKFGPWIVKTYYQIVHYFLEYCESVFPNKECVMILFVKIYFIELRWNSIGKLSILLIHPFKNILRMFNFFLGV